MMLLALMTAACTGFLYWVIRTHLRAKKALDHQYRMARFRRWRRTQDWIAPDNMIPKAEWRRDIEDTF